MTVTRAITRVDFVRQPDDSIEYCLEITETAPSPFVEGQTVTRIVDPRPMTPQQALDLYGLTMDNIVQELNSTTVIALDQVRVERDALLAEVTLLRASATAAAIAVVEGG